MEKYDNIVVCNIADEQKKKEYIEYYKKFIAKDLARLWVIYNPDCGCKIDQFVALDRYPMSPKIMFKCPECNQGCLLGISDPIIFHSKLENKDYSLEEMKDVIFTDEDMEYLVSCYLKELR